MSHRRNLGMVKLLLSASEIQEIVREARKFLALPPEGLPDSHEAIVEWREKTVSKLSEIETYLFDTSEKIVGQCGLPANYADSIRSYIIAGIIHAPPLAFSEGPYFHGNVDEGPRKSVTITFYSKLTDNDLTDLKKYVNNFAGRFLPETRDLNGVDKKILIEKLLSDREREDTATGEKYLMPTSEILAFVAEELHVKVTRADIHDNKRLLKKLRDKYFKKFGK